MKAAFYTLGCKVNQYESQAMEELFRRRGYEIVPPAQEADLYIVNSCTVTSSGDKKTRQIVRRLRREHPLAVVALTGCLPQTDPHAAEELPEADLVLGTRERRRSTSPTGSGWCGCCPMRRVSPSSRWRPWGTKATPGLS